ncbi:matrix metalloproteinase-14-like precursor [Hydra vulgaris]|uniref:Matrix metalloproteinase n=1 Tax=Hydra vulgaris TaxID=6087 RepID=Q9U9P0_HYDVU|nr:matrix metalloproteinase-14-like precursor [Hydra vulgaris]AAD45804.1 matrix metalloproteinase [Hydra vulgaris]
MFISLGFNLFFIFYVAQSLPVEHIQVPRKTLDYLANLGYYTLSTEVGSINNEKEIRNSIENLQRFAGIPVSGILDAPTQELIETPRCGLPDFKKPNESRNRRYTLQGTTWKKNELTWKLLNNNNDGLTRGEIETTLHKAFSMWEAVTNLKFRQLQINENKKADIEIKFAQGYHDDPYSFDGFGGTLAHAFYPHTNEGLSGDVHFDDAEKFTIESPEGRSLLWVAVHEIGHSIGLEHSNVKEALMFPWYRVQDVRDIQLSDDDVLGIQSIYGSKKSIMLPSTVTPTKKMKNSFQMKAVILDKSTGVTYAFNDDEFYKINNDLKKTEGPFTVSSLFPEVNSVNSGYMDSDGKLIFFKGTRYYTYKNFSDRKLLESGSIFDKYKGIKSGVKTIDAAFVWNNGRTYVFIEDEYYRFGGTKNVLDAGFPRKIVDNWTGVPKNIDSVFVWRNGVTYFFKGSLFYRVNEKGQVLLNYPKSISGAWLNFPNK